MIYKLYKLLANLLKKNYSFNYYLSQIYIQLEYSIDYLKKRFQSLKKLNIQINNSQDYSDEYTFYEN